MALKPTTPIAPFVGAPVIEVQLWQDGGMQAVPRLKVVETVTPPTPEAKPPVTPTDRAEAKPVTPPESRPSEQRPTERAMANTTAQTSPRVQPSASPSSSGATTPQGRQASPATPSVALPTAPSNAGANERRAAPDAGASGGSQEDQYVAEVVRWIDRHKRHPGRLAGVVTLSFEVDRRGRLYNSTIKKSSGDPRLDRIAQQQLREAAPLPRPPRNLTWERREITVSLDYRALR